MLRETVMNSPRPRTIKRDVPPACFYYLSIEVPWSLIIIIIFFCLPNSFIYPRKSNSSACATTFAATFTVYYYYYYLVIRIKKHTYTRDEECLLTASHPNKSACRGGRVHPNKISFLFFFFFGFHTVWFLPNSQCPTLLRFACNCESVS